MKKALFICAVCAAVAATACCGGKQQKVSAIVAGPDKVAGVVVEYAEALDAESVCPEAFVVEGKDVVCAKLVEPTKVVVVFKKDCCAKKHECTEAKEECGEAKECGEKHGCEAEAKECGEKHGCEAEAKECGEDKAECGEKHGCEKKAKCEKAEIAVPDIAVQQVIDLKTAEGKTVKAWKKAIKASAVECCPKPGRHHECGESKCDKPADEQCDKCKAAAQAE